MQTERIPFQEQVTYAFARRRAAFKLWVRKRYAHKFAWVKEGQTVRTNDGFVGKLTHHNYHPDTDTHLLEVTTGSKLRYYHCPFQLEEVQLAG